jgi:hypothetical protein
MLDAPPVGRGRRRDEMHEVAERLTDGVVKGASSISNDTTVDAGSTVATPVALTVRPTGSPLVGQIELTVASAPRSGTMHNRSSAHHIHTPP